ncbi:hypothetical protein RDWZM_003879 [Blomia tropicalis]|uniref:ZP domain-containing protein n=1 Tax=Blomia tropicalis TaxID=40697 RepID=A0A9Q0MGZ0_BLOTA|nr:hypothetical protein RDWZM_003879 [Blomia tropicalis]
MLTLNFDSPFYGRVYTKSNPSECFTNGNGQTQLESTSNYVNEVIVQQHSVIMTDSDRTIRVLCSFEISDQTITLGSVEQSQIPLAPNGIDVSPNLQGRSPYDRKAISSTVVANTAAPPSIMMRILDHTGHDAQVVSLGDDLTLRIELKDQHSSQSSTFAMFARNLYARSTNGESLFLIDGNGCPIDSTVFSALKLDPIDNRSLYSRFKAFRFPSTGVVNFEVQIRFCQQSCEPIKCPQHGNSGGVGGGGDGGEHVLSLGRRRRPDHSGGRTNLPIRESRSDSKIGTDGKQEDDWEYRRTRSHQSGFAYPSSNYHYYGNRDLSLNSTNVELMENGTNLNQNVVNQRSVSSFVNNTRIYLICRRQWKPRLRRRQRRRQQLNPVRLSRQMNRINWIKVIQCGTYRTEIRCLPITLTGILMIVIRWQIQLLRITDPFVDNYANSVDVNHGENSDHHDIYHNVQPLHRNYADMARTLQTKRPDLHRYSSSSSSSSSSSKHYVDYNKKDCDDQCSSTGIIIFFTTLIVTIVHLTLATTVYLYLNKLKRSNMNRQMKIYNPNNINSRLNSLSSSTSSTISGMASSDDDLSTGTIHGPASYQYDGGMMVASSQHAHQNSNAINLAAQLRECYEHQQQQHQMKPNKWFEQRFLGINNYAFGPSSPPLTSSSNSATKMMNNK